MAVVPAAPPFALVALVALGGVASGTLTTVAAIAALVQVVVPFRFFPPIGPGRATRAS